MTHASEPLTSKRRLARNLQACPTWITSSVAMFQITKNALRYFNLAEVLLMAATNQVEAKRNARPGGAGVQGSTRSRQ